MATIVNKKINGAGPYAYLVKYADGGHRWTYLGPRESINKDTLNDILESADDGLVSLDDIEASKPTSERRDEPVDIDLERRSIANDLREDLVDSYGESVLSEDDDRRMTTVTLSTTAPETALKMTQGRAEEMRAELESGAGQAPLTDRERAEIDFTATNVPRARAAKAAIMDEGVDEAQWLTVWSEDLTNTSEAREAAKRERETLGGEREDAKEGVERQVDTSFSELRGERVKSALRAAKDGDEAARSYLKNEEGMTDEEIDNRPRPVEPGGNVGQQARRRAM